MMSKTMITEELFSRIPNILKAEDKPPDIFIQRLLAKKFKEGEAL